MSPFFAKPRRILWITDQWPSAMPEWWHGDLRIDLLCLSDKKRPPVVGSQRSRDWRFEKVLTWLGGTGFRRDENGHLRIDSAIGLQNEELRRWFRDVLSEHAWDACVVDGLQAASPLLGDYGLEVPRSLSWLIYRRAPSETTVRTSVASGLPVHRAIWARIESWRLRRIEKTILRRAARVINRGEPAAIDLWRDDLGAAGDLRR